MPHLIYVGMHACACFLSVFRYTVYSDEGENQGRFTKHLISLALSFLLRHTI